MKQSVVVNPLLLQPLTITFSKSATLAFWSSVGTNLITSMKIKINDGDWIQGVYSNDDWSWSFNNIVELSMSSGDVVQVKASGIWAVSANGGCYIYINTESSCTLSGNINSLVHGDNFVNATTIPDYALANVFSQEDTPKSIVDISGLLLPATSLGDHCYYRLFATASHITTVPELPATSLGQYCYYQMFLSCSALTTLPSILPATSLANYCYNNMFRGCSSITNAPVLPATTLVNYCYGGMFWSCSSLRYIKMMATDISATACLNNWVRSVGSGGTFVKNSSATWTTTGNSGVPSGWTIQTESA